MVSHKPGLVRLPGVRLGAVVGRNSKNLYGYRQEYKTPLLLVPVNHVPVVCKKTENTVKKVQHAMHRHIGKINEKYKFAARTNFRWVLPLVSIYFGLAYYLYVGTYRYMWAQKTDFRRHCT